MYFSYIFYNKIANYQKKSGYFSRRKLFGYYIQKIFLPLGSESSYRHQLRGYLAGLAYLPGSNENEDVLKCLHQFISAMNT